VKLIALLVFQEKCYKELLANQIVILDSTIKKEFVSNVLVAALNALAILLALNVQMVTYWLHQYAILAAKMACIYQKENA
jgi:hypothetical protein